MVEFDNTADMPAPTSPLAGRAPLDGEVRLRELPWCGKLNLRGGPVDGDDANFTRAAADALGVALPVQPNSVAATERVTVFWLGPDEWLLHCKLADVDSLAQHLRERLAAQHFAVTEVTDYYAVLELRGDKSTEVLARGCPLDLHARAFAPGSCAQTRFGNASVLLHQPAQVFAQDADAPINDSVDNTRRFYIQVRWSFAGYVWDYLATVSDSLA